MCALRGCSESRNNIDDKDPCQTRQANEPLPAVLLPPLPALTALRIGLCSGGPFPRLAYILSSIHSTPALTSITFTFDRWWHGEHFPSSDPWVEVDKWLAKMALQTEVKRSLTVKLAQQQEDGRPWKNISPSSGRLEANLDRNRCRQQLRSRNIHT